MQTTVEIPRTEEQLRRIWGMGFKSTEQETVQVVIEISKEEYENAKWRTNHGSATYSDMKIANGSTLPKGYKRLIAESEILRFLKCPKYENCDWRNCYDCSQSLCINLNNVNQLVPIIEEDKGE